MLQARTLAVLAFGALIVVAGNGFVADPTEQMEQAKQAMLAHRYDEAAAIYKGLIKVLPNEPGLRFNLALALHSSGQYREAVQELEAIQATEQENAKFWFLLGLGYLKLDQPRQAIEPLRHARELEPSNLDARQELVAALLDSGYRTQGIAELRELVILSPADRTIQAKLAKELWTSRKYEEAIPMLESLVAANQQQLTGNSNSEMRFLRLGGWTMRSFTYEGPLNLPRVYSRRTQS
jgi:tetratricopeptide (TPR) repeat protein